MSLSQIHNYSSLFCFVSYCGGWRFCDCFVGGGSEHRRNIGGDEVEMKLDEIVAAASPGFHFSVDAFSPSCHRLGQQSWLLQPKTKKWRPEQEKMMLMWGFFKTICLMLLLLKVSWEVLR